MLMLILIINKMIIILHILSFMFVQMSTISQLIYTLTNNNTYYYYYYWSTYKYHCIKSFDFTD